MTRKRAATLAALTILVLDAPAPALAQPGGTAPKLVAGGGGAEFSGDGGPAVEAELNKPTAAAVAADGTLFVADMVNRRVRAIGPDGIIRTVAGNGRSTVPQLPLPPNTKGTGIALGSPNAITIGGDGTLFIADSTVSRVYALAPDGTITVRVDPTVLGGPINTINGLAVTGDGVLHLADRENNRVIEVGPGGGSRPISTPVGLPVGLAADTAGDVWIVSASSMLSRLHGGKIATIVESADGRWAADERRPTSTPFHAIAISAGKDGVYVIDNTRREARRLADDGAVSTAADLPADPFGADDPLAVAAEAAPAGPLYLVDTLGSRIFSAPVAASADNGQGSSRTPTWYWAVGGVLVVALLALLLWIARRRRA
ncbi:hypothetical protein Q0Z83_002070 [Actinoplanes sichuanensis]|uniref:Teneurin NHL domain-containing protein n=1 Tax=Actinoplanes sichuanensis TaxID=512349 RepID=A0ABW4AT00_9ACTN|nr:hypothetical protein [Actinoplanes sichuanensis]BEL02016.1 hypothetical protein Q0Z83_002070 [Actinoplanes sichuanensis]